MTTKLRMPMSASPPMTPPTIPPTFRELLDSAPDCAARLDDVDDDELRVRETLGVDCPAAPALRLERVDVGVGVVSVAGFNGVLCSPLPESDPESDEVWLVLIELWSTMIIVS